jgi:hypothetical protein
MQTYQDYNMFEGPVLVAENGKIIYKNAFGLTNFHLGTTEGFISFMVKNCFVIFSK